MFYLETFDRGRASRKAPILFPLLPDYLNTVARLWDLEVHSLAVDESCMCHIFDDFLWACEVLSRSRSIYLLVLVDKKYYGTIRKKEEEVSSLPTPSTHVHGPFIKPSRLPRVSKVSTPGGYPLLQWIQLHVT